MRIVHPDVPGQIADVPDSVYENILRHRDWVPADEPLDTGNLTISQVLEEVKDDPTKATLALESERAGRDRQTLTTKLSEIAHAETVPVSAKPEEKEA